MTNINKEEGGLSEEQKRALDRMIERLISYYYRHPAEFMDALERLRELDKRIKTRLYSEALLSLTEKEFKAFNFIRSELQRGHSPSVREVAKAIGLTSSRSGARAIKILVEKGILRRTSNLNGRIRLQIYGHESC